jgi:hypothetical protein
MQLDAFWKKLRHPYIWRRLLVERLSEPLHLNLLSLGVAAFGSTRSKIDFDLVLRPQSAACMLRAADKAADRGIRELTAMEFGVASGGGLLNMCEVAAKVTEATGVQFKIFGFDTGAGMPPPVDHRDHPELYREGDYPMPDRDALVKRLPSNAQLLIGPLSETIPRALASITDRSPIGYVSIDVDYYSSTKEALEIFAGPPTKYLMTTFIYFDDVLGEEHNPWAGEQLAVREFSDTHPLRRIERFPLIRNGRIFRRPNWLDQIWVLHVFDHPERSRARSNANGPSILENPYLRPSQRP